ncbi:MAG: hypothetical protein HY002_13120 [Candidatus Rokubacteria bacterium]|nr:hypothetical protein [Candidatus Rokubacteria bacterium]
MQRRIGFIVSISGVAFLLLPLSTLLPSPDFLVCAIGAAFIVIGVFFAIESVAKRLDQKP